MKNKYRYDSAYKKLYVWDEEQQAYVYICSNPYDLSEESLIEEYEREEFE